jgi:hypothetical protein
MAGISKGVEIRMSTTGAVLQSNDERGKSAGREQHRPRIVRVLIQSSPSHLGEDAAKCWVAILSWESSDGHLWVSGYRGGRAAASAD